LTKRIAKRQIVIEASSASGGVVTRNLVSWRSARNQWRGADPDTARARRTATTRTTTRPRLHRSASQREDHQHGSCRSSRIVDLPFRQGIQADGRHVAASVCAALSDRAGKRAFGWH